MLAFGFGECCSRRIAGDFTVTPQAGPWMILVASYRGDDSRLKAEEMCQELRQCRELQGKNISTYIFNRAAEEKRKESERVAACASSASSNSAQPGLPEDTPIRIPGTRIEDQYAVLVGGFKDDVAARKYLDDVRKLKPSQKLQLVGFRAGPGWQAARASGQSVPQRVCLPQPVHPDREAGSRRCVRSAAQRIQLRRIV